MLSSRFGMQFNAFDMWINIKWTTIYRRYRVDNGNSGFCYILNNYLNTWCFCCFCFCYHSFFVFFFKWIPFNLSAMIPWFEQNSIGSVNSKVLLILPLTKGELISIASFAIVHCDTSSKAKYTLSILMELSFLCKDIEANLVNKWFFESIKQPEVFYLIEKERNNKLSKNLGPRNVKKL